MATATKRNKQEEQKKLMVRIVCWVMVAALVLTSGLAMISWIFDKDDGAMSAADLQAYIDAGLVVLGDDGNYYWNLTVTEGTHVHEDGTVHENGADADVPAQ